MDRGPALNGQPPTWHKGIFLCLAWSLPISLFGIQAAVIVGTLVLVVTTIIRRGKNLFPTPLDAPIGLLLLAILISLALAEQPPISFQTATSFWVVLAYFVATYFLDSMDTLKKAWIGIMVLASVAAALGIFQSLTGLYPFGDWMHPQNSLLKPIIGVEGFFGAKGFFSSRHSFAQTLIFPFCWSMAWLLNPGERGRLRLLCAGVAVLCLGGMLMSWSRAVLPAIALGSVFLVGLRFSRAKYGRWINWALVLVVLIGLVIVPRWPERIGRSFSDHRDWGRLAVWQAALDLASERPLTGIGFGNFSRDSVPHNERRRVEVGSQHFAGVVDLAHNDLLSLLSQTGALGALAFCLIWVTYFRTIRQARKHWKPKHSWPQALVNGTQAAIIALLTVGIFHDTIFRGEVGFHIWFSLAVSLAVVGRLAEKATEGHVG